MVHAYSMPGKKSQHCCESNSDNILGLNPSQRLVLNAMVKPLRDLAGFQPEQRHLLLENNHSRGAFLLPHAFWDDPAYDPDDMDGVQALFIAQVGCGNKDCGHQANCGAGFAHCLLVKGNETGRIRTCRRLGVAQCYSGEFISGATRVFITLV
ncbi:hypothetical protein AYO20_07203 [Fonsecaea nubica]|uniref:Uncharacterized protein n=1 Tax=Fonsecaea nubica TaxID=856822 RepID=A0A178CVM2_9EURO|nr:hypothetical protein AYO20_07203 [Fonsecaea nubica]OAL33517.1 hypothetical protein AYO20_07203 [Fonsecaea nubica]